MAGGTSVTDSHRTMRLELLKKVYEMTCKVSPVEEGDLVACAEYHHEDEKYFTCQSMNIWGLQDKELVYIFSGNKLSKDGYESNMKTSLERSNGLIKPDKKLRCATITTILIYDSVDDDVLDLIRSHDEKEYHKMSLNGWSIHRVATVLTDSHTVVTDKRGANLIRRLNRIAEI